MSSRLLVLLRVLDDRQPPRQVCNARVETYGGLLAWADEHKYNINWAGHKFKALFENSWPHGYKREPQQLSGRDLGGVGGRSAMALRCRAAQDRGAIAQAQTGRGVVADHGAGRLGGDAVTVTTTVITRLDKLRCLERELKMRKKLYPRWVKDGRMASSAADHEIACVQALICDYDDERLL